MSPNAHSAAPRFCLMSARSVKRWARRLVFVWFGVWLSAALLHCDELAAAAHDQALSAGCENPAEQAPDSGGGYKTAACLFVDEPAPASVMRLAAPIGGSLSQSVLHVSSSSHLLPPLPGLALPPAYRAAPPPVAVYLRSPRLLI